MGAFEYHEAGYATRYPSSGLVQLSGSENMAAPNGVPGGLMVGEGEGSIVGDGDGV
jgi:hypothetical protein